ncbi:5-oxoprolinase subunit PxpB [Natronoglycomyces albus]|uniref:5-oxoprolinase subunit PxpB n=1 Tax=Natronoglycomyces albus TaxID=2811108 RepID=A0A895XP55_9ACTN|nr:5-oxoprolinase subunit PxpB [Natronoglycomyces albus]QSB05542.1 5-oxoprolinase subunit PxpB [Natronoglycomyces albus]
MDNDDTFRPQFTPLPAGPRGLLIECGTAEAASACYQQVQQHRRSGALDVTDAIPGATTVLLDGVEDTEALAARIRNWAIEQTAREATGHVEIPVLYDGPDVADVAHMWGVSPAEVPDLHSRITYRSAFCGFMPGFAYLEGAPSELHVPRRSSPRTRVPAGSVALAGPWCGVYPRETPGGWQLIGTMVGSRPLFDPTAEPAALLAPGTTVRFIPAVPTRTANEEGNGR